MGNCIRDLYNYELVEGCSKCNSICLKQTSVKIKRKKMDQTSTAKFDD